MSTCPPGGDARTVEAVPVDGFSWNCRRIWRFRGARSGRAPRARARSVLRSARHAARRDPSRCRKKTRRTREHAVATNAVAVRVAMVRAGPGTPVDPGCASAGSDLAGMPEGRLELAVVRIAKRRARGLRARPLPGLAPLAPLRSGASRCVRFRPSSRLVPRPTMPAAGHRGSGRDARAAREIARARRRSSSRPDPCGARRGRARRWARRSPKPRSAAR